MRMPRQVLAGLLILATAGLLWPGHAQELGDATAHVGLRAHRPLVPGVSGLVTSAHPLASMAGARILMQGGNAIDAAVAVAATLNLVEPQSSGFGGNGFTTIYDRKTDRVYSLGMTGAAPRAIKPEEMTPATLNRGIKAAIVPGNIGGLIAALDRFGTRSLAAVLQPAIEYAERGHPVNASFVAGVRSQKFEQFPSSARVFLPGGAVPAVGQMVRNPDLAATMRKLVEAEKAALDQGKSRTEALNAAFTRFYKGDIAQEIDRFFRENGGVLTAEDLAAFEPQWAEPLHTAYRGYDIYSNPSTSRGGFEVLMQLNLVEAYDLKALGHNSAAALHLIAEAIKVAKSDIYRYVADPKFTTIPAAGMLSKAYAAERRKLIDPARAIPYPAPGDPGAASSTARVARRAAGPAFPELYEDDPDTTSFSIADGFGNVVACTPTLGGNFGTGVVAGNTGLLLNNGMRLGSTSPYPDHVNYVRGGQIPLLNNSPVIVMKDGRFVLAIGTPGGETIGQTQFQAILNVIDFGLNIQEAIEAPRMRVDPDPNFYRPGAAMTIAIEGRVSPAAVRGLEALGHKVELLPAFTAGVGGMQGILRDETTGTLTGGADPRRAGYAIGW